MKYLNKYESALSCITDGLAVEIDHVPLSKVNNSWDKLCLFYSFLDFVVTPKSLEPSQKQTNIFDAKQFENLNISQLTAACLEQFVEKFSSSVFSALYYTESNKRTSLVFIFNHSIVDMISHIFLVNEFLRLVVGLELQGHQLSSLTNSSSYNIPQSYIKRIDYSTFDATYGKFRLPCEKAASKLFYVRQLLLSSERFSALLKKLKSFQISLQAFVFVLNLYGRIRVFGRPHLDKIIFSCPTSRRNHLNADDCIGLFVEPLLLPVDLYQHPLKAERDFLDLAKLINPEIKAISQNLDHPNYQQFRFEAFNGVQTPDLWDATVFISNTGNQVKLQKFTPIYDAAFLGVLNVYKEVDENPSIAFHGFEVDGLGYIINLSVDPRIAEQNVDKLLQQFSFFIDIVLEGKNM